MHPGLLALRVVCHGSCFGHRGHGEEHGQQL